MQMKEKLSMKWLGEGLYQINGLVLDFFEGDGFVGRHEERMKIGGNWGESVERKRKRVHEEEN